MPTRPQKTPGRLARAVIADAQVEAASIVSRARREAEEIAAQAAPQIAPEAVTKLCSAIEEFGTTNRVLVDELVQLRQVLAGSYADTPITTYRASLGAATERWLSPGASGRRPRDSLASHSARRSHCGGQEVRECLEERQK